MFASTTFLQFWIVFFDYVMAAILYKAVGALSRSYFVSDLLQIRTWCSLNHGIVCYKNQQDREISSIQNGVPRIGPAAILEPKIKLSQNV